MCGIYFCYLRDLINNCQFIKFNYEKLQRRGPDETLIRHSNDYKMAFYRLAINGIGNGNQPFSINGQIFLMCNGEIYNYKELANKYNVKLKKKSDCEIILKLYEHDETLSWIHELDGEYAFVIYNTITNLVHFSVDYAGVKPLYYRINDLIEISSEMKGLSDVCDEDSEPIQPVIPNYLYTYDTIKSSLTREYIHRNLLETFNNNLIDLLRNAVHKRITNTERKIGFLLSGGLDSSIILALALALKESCGIKEPYEVFTYSFSKDSNDVHSATCVINWLKEKYPMSINWHLVIGDVSEGINNIQNVIETIETYDTTTIRASIPMYLLSKYISENSDVKVILSGEGADELFGGYLYFKYAPNAFEYRNESQKLINQLYLFDCLRADRSTAAHGLEIRPPFLDMSIIKYAYNFNKTQEAYTMNKSMTKKILRKTAANARLLPYDIIWGKKEAFSDGVGHLWLNELDKLANFNNTTIKDMFKFIYDKLYNIDNKYIIYWEPNQHWINTNGESSARELPNY